MENDENTMKVFEKKILSAIKENKEILFEEFYLLFSTKTLLDYNFCE